MSLTLRSLFFFQMNIRAMNVRAMLSELVMIDFWGYSSTIVPLYKVQADPYDIPAYGKSWFLFFVNLVRGKLILCLL